MQAISKVQQQQVAAGQLPDPNPPPYNPTYVLRCEPIPAIMESFTYCIGVE